MFFSNGAYDAVNETHIIAKYRFRVWFYTPVFYNWAIFKESIGGQTRGSQKSKRGQSTKNWKMYLYMHFFGTNTHFILLILQNIDLDLYFTFLACLSRAIFKESIEGQTRGSKKFKFVKYN